MIATVSKKTTVPIVHCSTFRCMLGMKVVIVSPIEQASVVITTVTVQFSGDLQLREMQVGLGTVDVLPLFAEGRRSNEEEREAEGGQLTAPGRKKRRERSALLLAVGAAVAERAEPQVVAAFRGRPTFGLAGRLLQSHRILP